MIDVIMPTLDKNGTRTKDSLANYLPFDYNLIEIRDPGGWANAINCGLKLRGRKNDLIIIDDDVEILADTFFGFNTFYRQADVFGFKLMFPDSERIQHDGGWVSPDGRSGHIFNESGVPSYVPYVTASLTLIKASVLEVVSQMRVWPGYQWEDVAFCLDAWAAGFRVAYLPNKAIHAETATKGHDPRFAEKFHVNADIFRREYAAHCAAVSNAFGPRRRIPLGHRAPSIQLA